MKYLAILVLLLATAMAQGKKDKYNLDALYASPCAITEDFLANQDDAEKALAGMTALNLRGKIQWAVECMGEKKATANQLRAAGMTVYLAQAELGKRLAEAYQASEKQHASDLATMDSLRSQAERATKDADYYRFAAASTPAAPPLVQYESRPSEPVYQPTYTYTPEQRPTHCVASSSPLGSSTITSVNCN